MRDFVRRLKFYGRRLRTTLGQWEDERRLAERFPTATFESNVYVKSPHLLHLGDRVHIQTATLLHCGGMDWSEGRGSIRLGSDCLISSHCVFFGAGGIELRDRVRVAPGCMIFSSGEDYAAEFIGQETKIAFAPVIVEEDARLSAGTLILPGVTIGRGAVTAAGALVTRDVPAMSVVVGAPARVVRQRA